jgi:hypothetical protein
MGYKTKFFLLKKDSGQSTIEYVLLLAVVLTFMTTIWNSKIYKDFMGEDSEFFNGIAKRIEVNYQYSVNVPTGTTSPNPPALHHPSFSTGSDSRFFTYKEAAYPQ